MQSPSTDCRSCGLPVWAWGHPRARIPAVTHAAGLTLLIVLLLTAGRVSANAFSPRGLYDVDHRVLENGLRVVLKPRGDARNVSIRVVVNVGQSDFPCGQQELPHFLEHLLFTGTELHSEQELEALVRDYGGAWNASTGRRETVYEIDLFSRHGLDALSLMHEILTRSSMPHEKVELSREILRREASEDDGLIRRWTYAQGIGKTGGQKMLELFNYACPNLESPNNISREAILATWRKFYVASNITVIAVGDFEPARMLAQIESTFGQLPAQPAPTRNLQRIQPPSRAAEVDGTLGILLGNSAAIVIGFATVGYAAPERTALQLLEAHLNAALYDEIRTVRGLAYTPSASSFMTADDGLLLLTSDCDLAQRDEVLALMRAEIRKIVLEPPSGDTLESLKRYSLLASASDYETNASIADYYAASLHELSAAGRLFNEEDAIEAVTAEDMRAVAARYLDLSRAVTVVEVPSLSHRHVYWLIVSGLIILAVLLVRRWRARRRSRVLARA